MTAHLAVTKLHATGNDFLVVAAGTDELPRLDRPEVAVALCDRRRGPGADGLLLLAPGDGGADAAMRLRNADGGVAEMSGNGLRCLAWVAHRIGRGRGRRLVVRTDAGDREVELDLDAVSGAVIGASVDMGPVTFDPPTIPLAADAFDLAAQVGGTQYRGDAAGMGNPHFVLLVADPDAAAVTVDGPVIEHDPRFPARTNVEFVAVGESPAEGDGAGGAAARRYDGRDVLRMRVWERGAGETLSCGTGACAAAAVAHRRGLTGPRVEVRVPGGRLAVDLVGDSVRLGGPVAHVFDATVDLGVVSA